MLAPLDPPPPSDTDRRRRAVLTAATALVLGGAAVGAIVTAEQREPEVAAVAAEAGETGGLPDLAIPDPEQNELEPDTATPDADTPNADTPNADTPNADTADDDTGRADGGCTIGALSIRLGSTGDGVACLQQALADEGLYDGAIDGDFDDPTLSAVTRYQEEAGLFVDGVVGRESAIELGIWPDEDSLVVHTPPPPDGAMDPTGYLLSPVASVGDDAPPLPDGSGSGRRVVYDRAGQRVWAVDSDERIVRSWLVSGSKYSNEMPGTHEVYSRSEMSTAWNGQAWLPNMIRYQRTEIGHIGFHAIPRHVSDNSVYQTTDELGTRLSGGCQRQHDLDAAFLWAFADVGTTVVVT